MIAATQPAEWATLIVAIGGAISAIIGALNARAARQKTEDNGQLAEQVHAAQTETSRDVKDLQSKANGAA